jgi:DNA-binding PadR family transcriptional regulator
MKIPFYILGLLMRYGPQYGCNINQLMSKGIADFAKIKQTTIYNHLEKLKNSGYIDSNVGTDSNEPEKISYSITDTGINYFNSLINKILHKNYKAEFDFDGALYFHSFTDNNAIIKNLEIQGEYIQNHLKGLLINRETTISNIPAESRVYCKSIFNHHIHHLEAELKWIIETIEELS